jgi:hypothetical protein
MPQFYCYTCRGDTEQTLGRFGDICQRCGQEVSHTLQANLVEKEAKITQLESELQTERETTQQALQTSQEWHERQKEEIIAEWKGKLTNLIQQRKATINQEITLLREILSHD